MIAGLDAERRTAILGDMLELGPSEVDQHHAVLAHALETHADRVWAVGDIMREAYDAASRTRRS